VSFVDPVETFIEADVFFQFNPNLTSFNASSVENSVKSTMQSYFDANLGDFDQSFRRSNLLTDIDETDAAVLSSRAVIKMQKRFTPRTGVSGYTISFAASIASPDDEVYVISSDSFRFRGRSCQLRNRLSSNVLEIFSGSDIIVDNVGSYDASSGVITLEDFSISLIGGTFVKIRALPANAAAITPLRNNVLRYDAAESLVTSVSTTSV
jgi:hypothetical protein